MLGSFTQIQTIDTINMKLPHSMGSHSNSVLSNSNLTSQMTKRQKFKLEPIKILDKKSNKKLNLPESQRVVYIIEELIHRLDILDYISLLTTNDEKIHRLINNSLSDDERKKNYENMFVSMCEHHRTLVNTFNRGEFRRDSGQTRESLEMLIKSSCKEILRFMLKKSQFFEDIKKEFAKAKPTANPKITELKSNFKFVKLFVFYLYKLYIILIA